jgi:hypothetical protein
MKALIHLVPRAGSEAQWNESVCELVDELREHADTGAARVNGMLRLEDDPFGSATPYRAAIELIASGAGVAPFESQLAGLGERVESFAHPDLCTALVGEEVVFVRSERTPIRYQYLMRRNTRFDHAAYLKRYREIHSRFGLETPGIEGYTQFHVDPAGSRQLAAIAGVGVWAVDSVSELHLGSLEHFLDEVAKSAIASSAAADEEVFVDRPRSADFCCKVDWQTE